MKQFLVFSVVLVVLLLSACGPTPEAGVATYRASPRPLSTIIKTLSSAETLTTTQICSFKVSGCPGSEGGCFTYYEIIEGTYMSDEACDALIKTIQIGLNTMVDPETGKSAIANKVDDYPTSPVICVKAYTGHSTLTIVDPDKSEVSQALCDSLP
jgi:hypothetical protein